MSSEVAGTQRCASRLESAVAGTVEGAVCSSAMTKGESEGSWSRAFSCTQRTAQPMSASLIEIQINAG